MKNKVKVGDWIRHVNGIDVRSQLCQTGNHIVSLISVKDGVKDSYPNRWGDGVKVNNIFDITHEEICSILGSVFPLSEFEIRVGKHYVNLGKYLK